MIDDPAFVWDGAQPARRRARPAVVVEQPPEGAEVGMNDGSGAGDAVLVPLDQWSRILNQLGNLHEAGQQVADARERAAKAETEAAFLRERLKDIRSRLDEVERDAQPAGSEHDETPSFGVWFLRRQLERRRSR